MKRLDWRLAAPVATAGVLIAAIVLTLAAVTAPGLDTDRGGRTYVNVPLGDSSLGRLLAAGDGQFYYTLARDPSLARPEDFGGAEEAAYRAQRPLLPYLAWGASLGGQGALPFALAALVVLSAGLAAGACALLATELGAPRLLGLAVLGLPGSLAVLRGPAGELLALGLLAAGIIAWRRRATGACAALLTLAALARETTLIVPVVLAAIELARHRRWTPLMPALALPAFVWGAWISLVRFRYGAWPSDTDSPRLSAPFAGVADSVPRWDNPVANAIVLGIGVVIVAAVLSRHRRSFLAAIVVGHAALALVMGRDVWHDWENFARPLLPMYAFGLIVLAARSDADTPQTDAARTDAAERSRSTSARAGS